MKRILKFGNYKNSLEAIQLESKINHLEKNQVDIDSIKKIIENSLKKSRLILQSKKDLKVKGIMFLLKKLPRLL